MKQKKARVKLWGVLTPVFAVLLAASIVGNSVANYYSTTLNVALDVETYRIVKGDSNENTDYFTSDFASDEERAAYEAELCAAVEAEGATLLLNNNNALPLASGAKVSLFGRGSVDLMYGGTGSGGVSTDDAPTMKDALTEKGIQINETLWNWYDSADITEKYSRVTPSAIADVLEANGQYAVNEAPWAEVESANSTSFAEYGDAAIVVLARSGGEGADLPAGDNGSGLEWSSGQEGDGNYLALSQEEKDMLAGLKALKDAGTFKSIIVLLNSSNAIELDFLNPEVCGVDYGVDACMWIGDVGQTGINGVAQLLSGELAPSGSLVDTFWYDNLLNPAVTNFYSREYDNMSEYSLTSDDNNKGNQGMYSVYQEGIYLGYRYTETRYEDVVMGTGNAGDYNYGTTVAYPFGYGISYTTFDYSDYTVTPTEDSFEVSLTVTNTGDVAAKKTVQIYFQSPYTEYDKTNGIEKASVELCGFEKTDVLEPGQSQKVTITVDREELRTYDANNAKTYILDAGDYTSEDVMAATFNRDLVADLGRCIGEDCLAWGYSGLYGPGVNMHRTPYSGRNFEYYSEDPFVSGEICASEVTGIQSKGVYVYLKHVALNDSESSRMGVNTWLNEQTAREIYLEVADKAITEGGAWCTMSGFNRWGATWCGSYAALQTDYLRGELGMRGMSITDYSGGSVYMDVCDGIIAGSNIWDSPTPLHTDILVKYRNDAYIVSQMREAVHGILYTVANSNAMNGLSSSDRLELITPWWQLAIYALIGVCAVMTVLSAAMLVVNIKRKKELKCIEAMQIENGQTENGQTENGQTENMQE